MTATVYPLIGRQFDVDDMVSINDLTRSRVYTPKQVATMLGLTRAVIYDLLAEGRIPAKRLGRRWVIPRLAFDKWLNDDEKGQ